MGFKDIEIVRFNARAINFTAVNGKGERKPYSVKPSDVPHIISARGIISAKYIGSIESLSEYAYFTVKTEKTLFGPGNESFARVKTASDVCTELLMMSRGEKNDENTSQTEKSGVKADERRAEIPDGGYELRENELPRGIYVIGKDIPAGTYDFFVIYGSGGSLDCWKKDENGKIIDGTWNTYRNIGLKEDYEKREVLHVKCDDGYEISIKGDVIVKIVKSQAVKINLQA